MKRIDANSVIASAAELNQDANSTEIRLWARNRSLSTGWTPIVSLELHPSMDVEYHVYSIDEVEYFAGCRPAWLEKYFARVEDRRIFDAGIQVLRQVDGILLVPCEVRDVQELARVASVYGYNVEPAGFEHNIEAHKGDFKSQYVGKECTVYTPCAHNELKFFVSKKKDSDESYIA